jgi:hypothetical protein
LDYARQVKSGRALPLDTGQNAAPATSPQPLISSLAPAAQ